MVTESEFARRMRDLQRVVDDLKTAHRRSIETLPIHTKDESVDLPLQLDPMSGQVFCSKMHTFILNFPFGNNALTAVMIKSDPQCRIYSFHRRQFFDAYPNAVSATKMKFSIKVYSMKDSDRTTLEGGGAVSARIGIRFASTSTFTIAEKYLEEIGQ